MIMTMMTMITIKRGFFFRKVKGHKLIKERERNANERLFRYRGDRLKVGEMIGE